MYLPAVFVVGHENALVVPTMKATAVMVVPMEAKLDLILKMEYEEQQNKTTKVSVICETMRSVSIQRSVR
jgi:hypothetical protein